MNFANNLAERIKKSSQKVETKQLKTINATKDIEIQIGVNKNFTLTETKKSLDSRTVEEQIKSLTNKINKLKQSQLFNQATQSKIEVINEEISEIVTNLSNTDMTPKVGLVINEKLNFKIEKLKTNKLQLKKVIKTSKIVTKAFFTTIDESMFDPNYVAPNLELGLNPPKQEILIPIKSEMVNTIIYHTQVDEMYGYHVLEQNNIIRDSINTKKNMLAKTANLWTNWKGKLGMDSFSLKEIKR
jgi:hypothetical protein